MDLAKIDELVRNIKFDSFYLEATFQFKLLMQLAKIFDEDNIFPERNIEYYKLNPKYFSNEYHVKWNTLKNNFRYFVVEV